MGSAKSGVMQKAPTLRRPVPGTDLLLEVEKIVRDATWSGESPISLAEVKRRMHQKSPKHQQVRDLIDVLVYMGRITETADGVEFTYLSPRARDELGHVAL